jgi:hypothetical protein
MAEPTDSPDNPGIDSRIPVSAAGNISHAEVPR